MPATDPSVLEAVIKVVAKHFRVPVDAINSQTTALDVNGWDSLTHTLLLMHLEKSLGVHIDARLGFQAANVGELASLIEASRGSGS